MSNAAHSLTPVRQVGAHLSAVGRWLIRRRHRGLARGFVEVVVLASALCIISGYVRGAEPDAAAARVVRWLQSIVHAGLASGWLHPAVATGTVVILGSISRS